jgi:hypothetical protein
VCDAWQVTDLSPFDFIYLAYEQSPPKCDWFYRQVGGGLESHHNMLLESHYDMLIIAPMSDSPVTP